MRHLFTKEAQSESHGPSEQELDLLAELVAISAEYSETSDINGALAAFYPVNLVSGDK
jgi:hypothetical protein